MIDREKVVNYLKGHGIEPSESAYIDANLGRYVIDADGNMEYEFDDRYITITLDGEFVILRSVMEKSG